jgi:hypothetical protein
MRIRPPSFACERARQPPGAALFMGPPPERRVMSGVASMSGAGVNAEGLRRLSPVEDAVDLTQRLLATGAVALVIGPARHIHGLGDRLDVSA